jgi:glyoxylase-like metal-dependent hydrolase (beta-lactamase superfamily II)
MGDSIRHFTVGQFRGFTMVDSVVQLPAAPFFVNAPPDLLDQELRRHGMADGQFNGVVTCLFLDTGAHEIVLDTGYGPGLGPGMGQMWSHLIVEGIALGDVDTVILSHWHADHVGGAADADGKPAFPNARHVMARVEWDWAGSDAAWSLMEHMAGEIAHRSLETVRDQIVLVDGEHEVVPGVQVFPAPGHTSGHLAVSVSSEGQRLLCLGDAAVHPLHLEHPDWHMAFDQDPEQALATRRRLYNRAASERALVYATHFGPIGLGHAAARGAGWQWQPVGQSSDTI